MFLTAFFTPFPKYLLLSPSRNSKASWIPVEAPLGTAALPIDPSSNSRSHSTVGFPLPVSYTHLTLPTNREV